MEANQDFFKWFKKKYDEYLEQHREDSKPRTLTSLQNDLEIDQNILSRWLGGKGIEYLTDENIQKLTKLGVEIYDISGKPRP